MKPLALAVQFTLGAEKGFVIDDGGPTMWGVRQVTYDKYRQLQMEPTQSVQYITMPEVQDIMESEYWTPAHCNLMAAELAIAHFDFAYNRGVEGALKVLQGALGVAADGTWGPMTQAAVEAAGDSIVPVYLESRRQWYRDDTAQAEYLDGWLNRVNALQAYLAQNFPA